MKLLFVAHQFPYPLDEGIRIHTYQLLKHLSLFNEIHFVCFIASPEEDRYRSQIQSWCASITTVLHHVPTTFLSRLWDICFASRPFSVRQFWLPEMSSALQRVLKEVSPDAVHLDFMGMAGYLPELASIPRIFFPHDAVSMLLTRAADAERRPFHRFYLKKQAERTRQLEAEVLPRVQATVVVAPIDKEVLLAIAPAASIHVNPNGVDAAYFRPNHEIEGEGTLIFRGVMNFQPNEDAALFLIVEIMPKVWERRPDCRAFIVGPNPTPRLFTAAAGDPRISLMGRVDDLRVPMAQATVHVSPMRTGSGIKNKVLEAMAMEKAVVCTSMSLSAIDAVPGKDCLVAETADDLASHILELLADKPRRRQMGINARAFVSENHTWERHAERFQAIYETALAKGK